MANRDGVILKKCDRANHKPTTNKTCGAGTCQHTCDKIDRCPHAWTLRYSANGKQREQSFKDTVNANTGRVNYGSGRKLAQDAQLKLTHDKRAQGATFVDHSKSGKEDFGATVDAWIGRHAVAESTRARYTDTARKWVKPTFEGRTLAQVASDRDRVTDLLVKDMGHLSITKRRQARTIITSTLNEAVKAEKLAKHSVNDIDLKDNGRAADRADFVFPSFAQIAAIAAVVGIVVWLMRGCGLRICEALGVHKEDFRNGGKTLRVSGQATRDGRSKVTLKHRKNGEYRDVPVPAWLWELVKDMPDGALCPGTDGRPYAAYSTVLRVFQNAAKAAGIAQGFRPHSLRHAFASTLLSRGVPITDVSRWLGHKDIRETFQTYSHFMPDADDRAVSALNAEYAEWSKPTLKAA